MELVLIPQLLLVFYGFLVLGCGSVLGYIVARNLQRGTRPDPPLLDRRVEVLERELANMQAELTQLSHENAFLRELGSPHEPDGDGRLFVA